MRIPRVRFTIGRLMVAILVPGLCLWVVLICLQLADERRAEAAWRRAGRALDVAEAVLRKYLEEDAAREIAVLDGAIALARSDRERAFDRLEWSRKMLARGQLSHDTMIGDRLSLDRSSFELEQAQTRLEVLRKYTIEKQRKPLEIGIERARALGEVRRRQYEVERARRLRLLGL